MKIDTDDKQECPPVSTLDFAYSGSSASEIVFDIPGSELSSLNGIQINLGKASTAVINVLGTGNYSVGSAFNFQGLSSCIYTSVLWNFNSAASFTTSNEWAGSVLGPNLTFRAGQDVDGSVYVSNFIQGSNAEVHSDLFGGALPPSPASPTPVAPLPKPAFLGLGLLAVLGTARWGKTRPCRN